MKQVVHLILGILLGAVGIAYAQSYTEFLNIRAIESIDLNGNLVDTTGNVTINDVLEVSGDITDASLSSNVPLLNLTNTFTGDLNVNSDTATVRIRNAAGASHGRFQLSSGNVFIANDNSGGTLSIATTGGGALTLNSVNVTDFARLSQSALFTGSFITNSGALPQYRWTETDAAANNQNWVALANGEQWVFRVYDDAISTNNTAILIDRTGITIDEIELNATIFDLNGNADISGSLVLGTDLAVAQGGTGASDAATARTNLGAQASDAELTEIAGLSDADNNFIVGNGSAFVVESAGTARTSMGAAASATTISVSGTGLSGGGDLTANRTITIDQTAMETRNISGRAGNTKTLLSNASCPPASAGQNGQIWYCY